MRSVRTQHEDTGKFDLGIKFDDSDEIVQLSKNVVRQLQAKGREIAVHGKAAVEDRLEEENDEETEDQETSLGKIRYHKEPSDQDNEFPLQEGPRLTARQLEDIPAPGNENSSLRQERQNPQEAPDPLLAPHGILYHHVGEVREEIAQNRTHRPVAVKWEALYPGQLINDYNMVDFFKLMFPMQKIQQMLSLTNRNMKRAAETDKDHKYHPMDEAEFFRYIGIRLMIVRLKASTVKEYWEELQHEDSIHPPYNFRKRFGMPRWRFELIEKCLQWDLFDPRNQWWQVSGFIEAFNERRADVIEPGDFVVMDELISSWQGCGNTTFGDLPHTTYLPGKPDDEGLMMRSLACCICGVMLNLQLQKTAPEMELEEYQVRKASSAADPVYNKLKSDGDTHKYHTAVVLRGTKRLFGSGRVVLGDSAFASRATAVALRRHGLHFIGMVKTATVGYPMQFFEKWLKDIEKDHDHAYIASGVTTALISNYKLPSHDPNEPTQQLMAVGYFSEKKLKTLISTVSNTEPAEPRIKMTSGLGVMNQHGEREIVRKEAYITQPNVVADYYRYFHKVDDHNRFRQGLLEIEHEWLTQRWWMRTWATILGICVVDAYFLFKFMSGNKTVKSFGRWVDELAIKLCPPVEVHDGSAPKKGDTNHHDHNLRHQTDLIRNHPKYKNKSPEKPARLTCRVCHDTNHKTYHYCVPCSTSTTIFPIHVKDSRGVDRGCENQHFGDLQAEMKGGESSKKRKANEMSQEDEDEMHED